MTEIENNPHQALIEEKVAEIPTSYCIECDGRGDNVWVGTSGEPEQIPCNYCHGQGEITTLDRVKRTLKATIDTALEEERERTQKNFSLAVHNTCRKHKPEELKALTTLLNEPCLEALTPLPDKE